MTHPRRTSGELPRDARGSAGGGRRNYRRRSEELPAEVGGTAGGGRRNCRWRLEEEVRGVAGGRIGAVSSGRGPSMAPGPEGAWLVGLLAVAVVCSGFNLDTKHPVILQGPLTSGATERGQSYFGYSVGLTSAPNSGPW